MPVVGLPTFPSICCDSNSQVVVINLRNKNQTFNKDKDYYLFDNFMHKKCDKTDLKSIDIIIIVQNMYWIEPGYRPSFFRLGMREFGREFGHEWILLTLDTLITLLLGLQILGNAYFNPETYTP